MYIVLNDGQDIQWHVGEKWPTIWQPEDKSKPQRRVVEIQADGAELEIIEKSFDGLPGVKGNPVVVVWPNPWAEFIFLNMGP